jgi:hypothetical protein
LFKNSSSGNPQHIKLNSPLFLPTKLLTYFLLHQSVRHIKKFYKLSGPEKFYIVPAGALREEEKSGIIDRRCEKGR